MHRPTTISLLDTRLQRLPKPLVLALGLAMVAGIAALGTASNHGLPLQTCYIVPVLVVAWCSGSTRYGFVVALAATLAQSAGAHLSGSAPGGPMLNPALLSASALVQLLLYAVLLWLAAAARGSFEHREAQALRDELTGIANRRAFVAAAEAELDRSRRYRHELSLLYLDVDEFKAINDHLGHNEGNRFLLRLTEVLTAASRSVDTAARLGGDEFAILMPETSSRDAEQLAARLMAALSAQIASDGTPISCSCGLATFRLPPNSVDALLDAGDRLMYEAKAAGKNRVRRAVFPAARTKLERSA